MSDRITPNNPRFTEVLAGLLHELLRAAGTMVPVKGQERIRDVGRKLAETIEFHAERKAVEVAKLLQTAVKSAFIALEKDVADQKEEIKALRNEHEIKINKLRQDLNAHRIETQEQYRSDVIKSVRDAKK
jgi:hypothetical protein